VGAQPLVSVVTLMHNGEAYLAKGILTTSEGRMQSPTSFRSLIKVD
jgi:hypothetical protein